jgi:hypothetical protein
MNNDGWPVSVPSGRYVEHISPSLLSDEEKALLWDHLKSNHPVIARNLTAFAKDPIVQNIIEAFDGVITIEQKYLDEISIITK